MYACIPVYFGQSKGIFVDHLLAYLSFSPFWVSHALYRVVSWLRECVGQLEENNWPTIFSFFLKMLWTYLFSIAYKRKIWNRYVQFAYK